MLELYIVRDRRNGGTVVTVVGPGNLNLEIFLRSFDLWSGIKRPQNDLSLLK